ncbi:MAG: hypothetical protein HYT35_00890 [Candidatus Staskawiczbacteria bacterium]|nr:hypothetical protein [Candidatus Staskawiczbacteria bacterium]
MNERTKKVLGRMRQNTQAVVDAAFEKIETEQTAKPRIYRPESHQIIVPPMQVPMSANINRRLNRRHKFQAMLFLS